jgi:PAS domain S-box-containing protein
MPYKLECECIRLNGERFWGHVRGAALKDKSGKIVSLVGTVQDISEQKEAQQALRESESRWQFALNGSGDGVWDWDFETQKIILSAQGKAMLGYSENDDFGTSEAEWFARVHPDDIVRLQKKMVTHLLGKTPVFAAEYRLRTNSESWRWFLSRGKVVEYGPAKRPVRAIGTTTDISGRKETEARILALNERLELAVSSAGVGIWEYDMVTGNGLVNGQMNYIYGKIQKEDPAKVLPLAPGDNFKELFAILHPEDLERLVQFRDKAMTGRDIAEVEYRVIWPSGEVRHLRSAKQLICDPNGQPLRSLGTTLDITGYRRLAESLSKEKERLLLATRVGGVGIWELVDGRYLWDDQMYSLYGLKPGTFKGTLEEWLGFLHPEDAPRIIEQWQTALGGCSPFADTFRIIQPSGEWRHIRARAQITIGPDGTSIGALGTNWDVSEQIRLNEALFVEKERLSLATKAAGVGIWEYDFGRDQCLWDSRTHEIFGHGPGHFRSDTKPGAYGGTLEESLKILHPDDAIRIRAQYKKAAEIYDPGVMEMEFRAAGENGTWRHIRTLARVISDSRGVAKRLVA